MDTNWAIRKGIKLRRAAINQLKGGTRLLSLPSIAPER
jgi:hypothetical protein